jgi:uncharacterized protein (DUF2267 family)
MDRQTFLRHASHRLSTEAEGISLTAIDGPEEAEPVVEAVLRTLGESLSDGTAASVAAGLPEGIGDSLRVAEGGGNDYEDFLTLVGERTEFDREESGYAVKATLSLVADAADGASDELQGDLPDSFGPLFEFVDADSRPWDKYEARVD